MSLRIAKIDQQSIADILGNIALEATDSLGANLLIGPDHVAQGFNVQLFGEGGRADQVAEHHGQLATLGFRSTADRLRRKNGLVRLRADLNVI